MKKCEIINIESMLGKSRIQINSTTEVFVGDLLRFFFFFFTWCLPPALSGSQWTLCVFFELIHLKMSSFGAFNENAWYTVRSLDVSQTLGSNPVLLFTTHHCVIWSEIDLLCASRFLLFQMGLTIVPNSCDGCRQSMEQHEELVCFNVWHFLNAQEKPAGHTWAEPGWTDGKRSFRSTDKQYLRIGSGNLLFIFLNTSSFIFFFHKLVLLTL